MLTISYRRVHTIRGTKSILLRAVSFFLCFLFVSFDAYSAEPTARKRDVMLYDLRHRQPIRQKLIEGHLELGSLNSMSGRYNPYDRAHGNGYALFRLLFSDEFDFRTTTQRLNSETLDGVRILLLINPDSKAYLETAHLLSDDEIRAITEFVRAGGGLFVTTNSFTELETYELERTNKLLRHFGVEFERTWTPYFKCPVAEDNPSLFNVTMLYYGGGCTIKVLDSVPQVKVDVILRASREDMDRSSVYPSGYEKAPFGEGPIITLSQYGKGRVVAVGDSGTWAHDDLAVAGTDNLEILKQLIALLRDPGINLFYKPTPGQRRRYKVGLTQFVAAPDPDLLEFFAQPSQVKKQPLPPKSWPSEFWGHYSEFNLEKQTLERDSHGNSRIALELHMLNEGQRSQIGSSEFYLAPKGQVLRPAIQAGSTDGRSVLAELIDSASVIFSDPLLELGGSWENDVWVKILPLEIGKEPPSRKKISVRHILEGIEEKRGVRCAKIVTYGLLAMKGVDISELVSTKTLWSGKVAKFRVEQGMQVIERVQYFGLEDGELIESESYSYSRMWLDGLGFRGNEHGYIRLYERVSLKLQ